MRITPCPSLLVAALACIALLSGCPRQGGGSVPSTPPTFVLAWTGADNRVHTMQSTDGSTWVLPTTAPGPTSDQGVAVAHDGTSGWMVMWNSGGRLSYVSGIGGLPSATASAGINWESTAGTLRTSAVAWTPALAYGDRRWMAVYLGSGGLRIVPSILNSSTTTPADEDLGIGDAVFSPALAFGAGKFVLAYLEGPSTGPSLVARTSTDGRTWSQASPIFPWTPIGGNPGSCLSPTSVTLSFADGAFYATGRLSTVLCGGNTWGGGSSIAVYRSSDGVSWTTLVNRQTGPSVVREDAGVPGSAFAQCHLVVAYTQLTVGTAPITPVPNRLLFQIGQPSSCSNPVSFTFGAPQTIASAPTARLDSEMAVVFGRGPGQ